MDQSSVVKKPILKIELIASLLFFLTPTIFFEKTAILRSQQSHYIYYTVDLAEFILSWILIVPLIFIFFKPIKINRESLFLILFFILTTFTELLARINNITPNPSGFYNVNLVYFFGIMTLFVFIQDRESLLFKKYFIWIIGVLSSVMVGEALFKFTLGELSIRNNMPV